MTERAERDDHVGARDDPGGKRRRPDFWSRPRRLLALAFLRTGSKRVRFGLAAVLGFALWAARTGLLCHGDADCWLGERQTIVATSKLSNKYDPSLAEQPVFVYDMGGVRALKFGAMGDSVARQSRFDQRAPGCCERVREKTLFSKSAFLDRFFSALANPASSHGGHRCWEGLRSNAWQPPACADAAPCACTRQQRRSRKYAQGVRKHGGQAPA